MVSKCKFGYFVVPWEWGSFGYPRWRLSRFYTLGSQLFIGGPHSKDNDNCSQA